tara:strand:- start:1875 stop:2426 length:552 start_codon:yes stop_codon:yes gene_type:complete
MLEKDLVRKKYYSIRKKKYFEIKSFFFSPFIKLIKSKYKNKKIKIAMYYPSAHELNTLRLLEINHISHQNILLPVIEEKNVINFFTWKQNEVLLVNKYGMLEPIKSKAIIPDVIMVPLLAFDKRKYRLGYGKGYYDRYLNKYLKKFKNILTVGIAFSFQKHHKLPVSNNDVKLNYILTEKGIF